MVVHAPFPVGEGPLLLFAGVKPARFELHRPTSVDEAVDLLSTLIGRDQEAKVIAGGQSLVPMMNFRLAQPEHLVDLSRIDELRRVDAQGDQLIIGAMATQRDCLAHPSVAERSPLLAKALSHIGHAHIRNRGTIGGSIAHADPAAELPTALIALGGEIEIVGPYGRRVVPGDDFFDGWFSTGLGESEILTAVLLPPMAVNAEPGGSVEWGFEELARRDGDYAMVLAATVIERDGAGRIIRARVVLGGVGPTPVRAERAEQILVGSTGADRFDEAAATARLDCSPSDDVHADAAYRSEMVEVLVRRSLRGARAGADGRVDRRDGAPDRRRGSGEATDPSAVGTPITEPTVVNGTVRDTGSVPDRKLLADWLRDDLDLTGTHLGCEHGVCGACTVLVDDVAVRSCLMFARQAEGRTVTTIEHLGTPDELHPIQEAFRTHHGLQCGFCTPGMVLATADLLGQTPDPDEQEIREALSGNICRCTGYVKIVEAVRAASVEIGRSAQSRTTAEQTAGS